MRCLVLATLLYLTGLAVLVLSLFSVPLDACTRCINRLMDWAEIEYWLAVIERKTRAQVKAKRVH